MSHEIANYLYSRLPEVYRIQDEEVGGDLKTFLEILGGDVDYYNSSKTGLEFTKEEILGIMNLLDIKLVPDEYLEIFGEMFGFPNSNFGLPLKYYRKIIGHIVLIYQQKSTLDIIKYVGKLLSGVDVYVYPRPKGNEHGGREEFNIIFFLQFGDENLETDKAVIQKVMEYLRPINCYFYYVESYTFIESYDLGIEVTDESYGFDTISYPAIDEVKYITPSYLTTNMTNSLLWSSSQTRYSYLMKRNDGFKEIWIDDIITIV